MTVYVDNFRAPATVGRIKARWSHLTADTVAELHEFAAQIGQRPEWFQAKCKSPNCPVVGGTCAHFHYDVVDRKRTEAIRLGAKPIDVREMVTLIAARRAQYKANLRPINEVDDSLSEPGQPVYAPCRPIGCDAGYHLPGCVYDGVTGGAA